MYVYLTMRNLVSTNFQKMRNCGNEITRISTMLLQDAQQNTHHGSMPERMPSLNNIDLLHIQQEKLSASLQRVADRVVAQGQYQGEQNGATQSGKPVEEYSQEELNWDDGRNIGGYGGPDAKKRRGVCFSTILNEYRTNINPASGPPRALP